MAASVHPERPDRGASVRESQEADSLPLRLSVTRGVLGLELYQPVEVGPATVRALAVTLPDLPFPVDLSGGVRTFRHRRGELEYLDLQLELERLGRWLAPRLRDVLPGQERPPTVFRGRLGVGVGLIADAAAVAFELAWVPVHGTARWVVVDARGAGLEGPALGYALRAVDAALAKHGQRRGRIVEVPELAGHVTRAVLPAVGARAPSVRRARLGELQLEAQQLTLTLDASIDPPPISEEAARALELAELVREADDALSAGELDLARRSYVSALEQAPRHPEISQIVAEIDYAVDGRGEAALGLLIEAQPAAEAGVVGAELLAQVGDYEAARTAIERRVGDEVFAPLAALWWLRFSELQAPLSERLEALDQAVARSPGLARTRWARLEARLELGDAVGALADAEHLEAGAQGSAQRHAVVEGAARRFLEHGLVVDAGKLFERALRYVPDDAHATAGLARALTRAGKAERALPLLNRALQLAEREHSIVPGALLDLARLLAERLGDLPQAIVRARQVPAADPEALEARGLEARWRAQLGDIAGAALAHARVRQQVELGRAPSSEQAARWLLEAARFESEERDDLVQAERHLAVALRAAPKSRQVSERYRAVARQLADRARARYADLDSSSIAEKLDAPATPAALGMSELDIDALTAALTADPNNSEIAERLALALGQAGRDEELFALLSARVEDGDAGERARLLPSLVEVLTRLRDAAADAGDASAEALYESLLERWNA